MNTQESLDTLNSYLSKDSANIDTKASDWDTNEYKEAVVFSTKAPARSNKLYLVKGTQVISFAPGSQTIEEAYSELI